MPIACAAGLAYSATRGHAISGARLEYGPEGCRRAPQAPAQRVGGLACQKIPQCDLDAGKGVDERPVAPRSMRPCRMVRVRALYRPRRHVRQKAVQSGYEGAFVPGSRCAPKASPQPTRRRRFRPSPREYREVPRAGPRTKDAGRPMSKWGKPRQQNFRRGDQNAAV